jgi:hypothetical protein
MTTIKKITSNTFNNKVSYTVELSDGRTGYMSEKDSDKDLKDGEAVEATLEVKKNKKGQDYNLFTLKRASSTSQPAQSSDKFQQSPQKSNITPLNVDALTIFKEKCANNRKAMELIMQFVIADKTTFDQITDKFKIISNDLNDGVDDLCKE